MLAVSVDWRRVLVCPAIACEPLLGVFRASFWLAHWPGVVALAQHADHAIYMVQAHRVLAGGPPYPAWELSGPFYPARGPEVYPPLTVYGLLVPMSLVPDVLWWLVPLGALAAVVVWHRPSEAAWAVILALLIVEPDTWVVITAGNPSMWVTAAIALGTIWRPVAVFAVLKPPLAPLALLGVRSRGWWIAGGVVALLSLAWWQGSIDYVRVLGNYRASLAMPPKEWALLAIPLVAWAGRTRSAGGLRQRIGPGLLAARLRLVTETLSRRWSGPRSQRIP